MGEWVSKLWEAIKKVASTPTMVLASPGAATSYATTGLYIPRVKSTVGNEAGYLLDVVTAPAQPSEIKATYQIARHPVLSARAAKKAVGEGVNYVKKKLAPKKENTLYSPELGYTSSADEWEAAIREFERFMSTGKIPEKHIVPKSVYEVKEIPIGDLVIINNTSIPRMQRFRPDLSIELLNDLYSLGMHVVPREISGILMPRGSGVFYRNSGRIAVKQTEYGRKSVPHEFRHRIDSKFPLVLEEKRYLENAYDPDIFLRANDLGRNYDASKELVTTNLDARNLLFKDIGKESYLVRSVDEQNAIIDAATTTDIIDAVRDSNGYGRNYIEALKYKLGGDNLSKIPASILEIKLRSLDFGSFLVTPELWKPIADAIKESMKYVGIGTGVATVVNKQKSGGKLIPKRKKANSR